MVSHVACRLSINMLKIQPRGLFLLSSVFKLMCRREKQQANVRCLSSTNSTSLKTVLNRRPTKRYTFSIRAKPQKGLFGYPELASANGFQTMQKNAQTQVENLIEEATNPVRRKRPLLKVFDEISDTLCRVADLAEFARNMHPDPTWQAAADDCCRDMHTLVQKLNTNVALYKTMKHAVESGNGGTANQHDIMDEVDHRTARAFLVDFEESGIHLTDSVRERVVNLFDRIQYSGSKFMRHSAEPRYFPKESVPADVWPYLPTDGECVVVPGQMNGFADTRVREIAYKIFLMPEREQEERFQELLRCRYELAQLTGFKSFSERGLESTLIRNYDILQDFLTTLSTRLRPLAAEDYNYMLQIKRMQHPTAAKLEPWDVLCCTALARIQHSKTGTDLIDDLAVYFPLGACFEGLSELLYELYSIRLEVDDANDEILWSPDIYKLRVVQYPDEHLAEQFNLHANKIREPATLGYIYCDFYERERKPGQDCHFTIRCGRELDSDGTYQLPIVVLCVGLPTPHAKNEPSLLHPPVLETLFHEMGHAIHSMLGRTRYQHVTGTRCPTDFAEVPSTMLELFASDARVLSRISSHYQSGEKLSADGELAHYCSSKRLCAAAELQQQAMYSILDQTFYGREKPEFALGGTTKTYEKVFNQHYGLPYVKNTAWQLRFGHLFSYGGRYYSYSLAKAVAALIWKQMFAENPYSAHSGRIIRQNLLIHGGERHPYSLVCASMGFEPTAKDYVESILTLTTPHASAVMQNSHASTASVNFRK